MYWKSIAATALVAQQANAQSVSNFLRFGCSQLVIERSDPLVEPGVAASAHAHQIVGGNAFNLTMDPAQMDPAKEATCTTCSYSEDFSNYWTGALYFKSPENGSYKRVPQMANVGIQQTGGMTVYYMFPYTSENTVTIMKKGFRMLAGNPALRKGGSTDASICHRCNGNGEGFAPCDSKDSFGLPNKPCPGGIRSTILFPSCWDGKNLDSPDHMSHVAYSGTGLARKACPSTHPVRIPQVMYEVMWDTKQFLDSKYYGTNKQPLVYSFGDATGFGQHADYLFGWKDGELDKAMAGLKAKTCNNANCPAIKMQSGQQGAKCTKAQQVKEDVGLNGWITELPGNVKVN